MNKRRTYSAQLKAQVTLQSQRGDKRSGLLPRAQPQ